MGQRRDALVDRAGLLPGWVGRAGRLPVLQKAQGARVYDVDNVGFIDYTGAAGGAIVGHANQFVLDAVRKVLGAGVPGGFPTQAEVELAEGLEAFVPWAGAWFLFASHGEALHRTLAWVRRTTGKPYVLVLDGSGPELVARAGDGPARTVPAWNLERVEAALAAGGSKIGGIIVDPILSGFGVVPPPEGVLAGIGRLCRESGTLFILDELRTGFRVHRGGMAGLSGLEPDLAIYGGALSGGFPLGALAVRRGLDLREVEVLQGGAKPQPVGLAAAEAILSTLKNDAIYERLEERTVQLEEGLVALAERFGRPMTVNRLGSIFSISMSRGPVIDRESWEGADRTGYRRLTAGLHDEGVLLPVEPSSPAFVSSAHGAKDIEDTLEAFETVLLKLHQEDLP
ncbi:MAG: aminotransferase class III-fold pyridoxal phosphate-dependent enzyme [Acidobacteria bacterium]|nr:aminotransferase class III-fold pyridoxal phosphate-dependent enzyme [Acidobacteriota bacterium]